MITIFSGTNRKNSRTKIVSEYIYQELKKQTTEEIRFFSLEDLPLDFFYPDMYSEGKQAASILKIQEEFLAPANKFYFIVPEYNGGIPGVLKLFIDACAVRAFHGNKKAALLGVSAGRSGGLRGMEYMTGFLNYLKVTVLPNKLPVSSIETLMTDNQLTNEGTQKAIQQQIQEFLDF